LTKKIYQFLSALSIALFVFLVLIVIDGVNTSLNAYGFIAGYVLLHGFIFYLEEAPKKLKFFELNLILTIVHLVLGWTLFWPVLSLFIKVALWFILTLNFALYYKTLVKDFYSETLNLKQVFFKGLYFSIVIAGFMVIVPIQNLNISYLFALLIVILLISIKGYYLNHGLLNGKLMALILILVTISFILSFAWLGLTFSPLIQKTLNQTEVALHLTDYQVESLRPVKDHLIVVSQEAYYLYNQALNEIDHITKEEGAFVEIEDKLYVIKINEETSQNDPDDETLYLDLLTYESNQLVTELTVANKRQLETIQPFLYEDVWYYITGFSSYVYTASGDVIETGIKQTPSEFFNEGILYQSTYQMISYEETAFDYEGITHYDQDVLRATHFYSDFLYYNNLQYTRESIIDYLCEEDVCVSGQFFDFSGRVEAFYLIDGYYSFYERVRLNEPGIIQVYDQDFNKHASVSFGEQLIKVGDSLYLVDERLLYEVDIEHLIDYEMINIKYYEVIFYSAMLGLLLLYKNDEVLK